VFIVRVILALLILLPAAALADKYEITGTGELESDPTTKQEEVLLKFEQDDDLKKYSQDIELNIDNGFTKTNGEFVKTKDLFDYEHDVKYFGENDVFSTGYFRRKYDSFSTTAGQNYSLITAGVGLRKKHEDEEVLVQLSVGQRRSAEDVYILMPKASYKNKFREFTYKVAVSLVKESNVEIFDSEFTLSYPINDTLSLKYLFEYESSEDHDTKEFRRLNKLALSVKF